MKPNHTKYFIPDDIAQQIRMVARFEVHKETDPNCKINEAMYWKPHIVQAIANRVARILIDEEKKKLLR